jgi:eukaryotic-like serine/threonine-protein kinase
MTIPTHFGRYEVQDEIGDGAMGRVYRCFDPSMRRTVAVKTVKSEYLTRESADDYLRRFRREAQAAGRLAHPNIVAIYDVGDDYFVMEYLEGTTLQKVLKARGRLHLEEAIPVLAPLADALDYAHRCGIIHRDIKPANVMVLSDGRPKLMDFGVAHLESSMATASGHFFGSPSYMSPEQVSGGEVSHKADLFSFAVVAYETITGQRPFQGDSITSVMYRVVHEPAAPPRQWDTELPPSYDDIFRCALSKDPAARFPDAISLAAALQQRDFDAALLEVFAAGPAVSPAPDPAPSASATADSGARTEPPSPPPAASPPASLGTGLPLEAVDTVALDDLPSARVTRPPPIPGKTRPAVVAGGLALLALWAFIFLAGRRSGDGLNLPLDLPDAEPAAAAGGSPVFRIETVPPGAVVWVDDRQLGPAPRAVPDMAPGRHTVRVAAAGYAPAELSLELLEGTTPPPLRFVMEPITGRLDVDSEPAEATVKVDGQAVGRTPLAAFEVGPGRHEVRFEKKGFLPGVQRVDVRAGETLKVAARLQVDDTRVSRPAPAAEPTPPTTWVAEGDLVEMDGSVLQPRKVAGEWADYPEAARRLRLRGRVRIDMVITEDGSTSDLRVVESAGEILDRAVLDAVRKWRFEPARKNGVKVKVRWQAKQSFVDPTA